MKMKRKSSIQSKQRRTYSCWKALGHDGGSEIGTGISREAKMTTTNVIIIRSTIFVYFFFFLTRLNFYQKETIVDYIRIFALLT